MTEIWVCIYIKFIPKESLIFNINQSVSLFYHWFLRLHFIIITSLPYITVTIIIVFMIPLIAIITTAICHSSYCHFHFCQYYHSDHDHDHDHNTSIILFSYYSYGNGFFSFFHLGINFCHSPHQDLLGLAAAKASMMALRVLFFSEASHLPRRVRVRFTCGHPV